MKKYFTTLDLENGKYVGTLHDPDTNQIVYKTKSYSSQSQVTTEINQYLTKSKTDQNSTSAPVSQTIVNTSVSTHNTAVSFRKNCCGR